MGNNGWWRRLLGLLRYPPLPLLSNSLLSPMLLRYNHNTSIFLSQLLANQWNRGWGEVSSYDVLFTFRFFVIRLSLKVLLTWLKTLFSITKKTIKLNYVWFWCKSTLEKSQNHLKIPMWKHLLSAFSSSGLPWSFWESKTKGQIYLLLSNFYISVQCLFWMYFLSVQL